MKTKVLCPVPFNHCIVSTNGNVRCCCYQSEEHSMGNLNEQSFEEIWNGDRFQKIRQQMLDMEYPNICKCKENTGNIGLGREPLEGWFIGEDEDLKNIHSDNDKNVVSNLEIGAFYYIWYNQREKWLKKCVRGNLEFQQHPSLGEYSSLDDDVISKHIDFANSCGIDFFIVCITKDLIRSNTFRVFFDKYKSICKSKDKYPKLSIQIETLSYFNKQKNVTMEDMVDFKKDIDIIKTMYDKDITYFYGNKDAAIFLYVTREILNIDFFMECLRSFLPTVYFICDEVFYGEPNLERIRHFDAIYAYNMYLEATEYNGVNNKDCKIGNDFLNFIKPTIDKFKMKGEPYGVKFIPTVMPRYNDKGVRPSVNHYVIPEENGEFFKNYLKFMRPYMDDMLLITSWNEWYEDTQIEPCGNKDTYGQASSKPEEITDGHDHNIYYHDYLKILMDFKNNYNNIDSIFENQQILDNNKDEIHNKNEEENILVKVFGE